MSKGNQSDPSIPFEQAMAVFEKNMPAHQLNRMNALFGGGVLKKLIGQVIQGIIGSLLSGAFSGQQAPMDATTAHNMEKVLAEVQAQLPNDQLAVLNAISIDWKKLIAAIIQAVLAALSNVPAVPESAPVAEKK